jgi:hypothetical protein
MEVITKECARCGNRLPATREYFHRRGKNDNRLDSYCKECRLEGRRDQYKKNPEYFKDKASERRRINRAIVLGRYGGKCACCGEREFEFLAIDHIDNNGSEQRTELGHDGKGHRFVDWLIKQGFPHGYRVLCHNCNMSMGLYGYCPHQLEGS